jgi:uroporphyrin-III C-methyltransferase
MTQRSSFGKVWLVGFGPGDPELLTIKGYKLIKTADIIFYDDLLNKEFLLKFPSEKVYVGKRKGNHSIEQAEINELLYNAAVSGKTVVRLKGGDPMLFAHGGEEIEYLERRHIEVEVVPGITAALAAAAFTHVPLTHRGIASSVSFITGHANREIHVPLSGTLVYYMGASNLRTIAEEVVRNGWPADTPVLLVYNVSGIDQEEYCTTLQKTIDQPGQYKTPLIIIIGEVVRLKSKYDLRNNLSALIEQLAVVDI